MISQDLKQFNLPDGPGVYFFKQGKSILYVGKATSLHDRVRSYFNKDLIESRGPRLVAMLELADSIDFIQTDSVLEALILEAREIKKHQPKYNARDKDNKSFYNVIITKEDFPRVLMVRERELEIKPDLARSIKYTFGPFPYPSELREALKIIRKIFTYRDKCSPLSGRACFNVQIGLCPGVCSGAVDKREYAKIIRNIKLFFEGKKSVVIKNFEKDMKFAAKRQDFETAAKLRNKIFALNHIQDVALIKNNNFTTQDKKGGFRIEAYDVAHLSGGNTVGVMTVSVDGEPEKAFYRKFKLKGKSKNIVNDTANLKEIISRRLEHSEWPLPDLMVVDGGKAQINIAMKVLEGYKQTDIPVVGVVKDEYHRPREIQGDLPSLGKLRQGEVKKLIQAHERAIVLINSEAHRFAIKYHRQRRNRMV